MEFVAGRTVRDPEPNGDGNPRTVDDANSHWNTWAVDDTDSDGDSYWDAKWYALSGYDDCRDRSRSNRR